MQPWSGHAVTRCVIDANKINLYNYNANFTVIVSQSLISNDFHRHNKLFNYAKWARLIVVD